MNPALGGGETVRVCNPCVPDPNYGPPPQSQQQQSQTTAQATTNSDFPAYDYNNDPQRASTFHSPQRSPERTQPDRYRSIRDPASPTRQIRDPIPYFSHHQHHSSTSALPPSEILEARFRRRVQRAPSDTHTRGQVPARSDGLSNAQPIPPPTLTPRRSSSQRHTSGSAPPAYAHMTDRDRVRLAPFDSPTRTTGLARPTGHRRPVSTTPAIPVREEDECPVCGTHAPPFGPSGNQPAREQHIEACINSHLIFSSTPQRNTPEPTSALATPVDDSNNAFNPARLPQLGGEADSPSPAPPPSSTPTTLPPLPPAARSHQRMLVYHATEKDCHDDTGAPVECVICLDDFEPGQEMGRLECLCKFHRPCIKGWWESGKAGPPERGGKGDRWGTCPTHALQEP